MSAARAVLMTALSALMPRVFPRAPVVDPGDVAVIRMLRALGHDPKRVLVRICRGKRPGIEVLTRDRKPVRFYTLKTLAKKRRDPEFLRRWQAAG